MSVASGRLLHKVSWNVVDQGLSALSNLVLSIIVARSVSAEEFGIFALAFLIFGILVAISKSTVGEPLQIQFASASTGGLKSAIAQASGAAVLLGVVAGGLVAVAALLTDPAYTVVLLALAVSLPALVVQDTCRMAMFAQGEPRSAALIDGLWALIQFVLVALLIVNDLANVQLLILAWGVGAAVSACVGLLLMRTRPLVRSGLRWYREHRTLIKYLFPEYLLGLGAMQFSILLVGVIASASAVGSLRAAQVLLGPVSVLGVAIFQFAMPEVARRPEMTVRQRARLVVLVSGCTAIVTLVYGMLLLVMPDSIGNELFGDSWAGAATVLLAMSLSAVFSALAIGPASVLYGTNHARLTFRINLAKGPFLVIVFLTGTHLGGAAGAAWALALTELAVLPAWIGTLIFVLRRSRTDPDADAAPKPEGVADFTGPHSTIGTTPLPLMTPSPARDHDGGDT